MLSSDFAKDADRTLELLGKILEAMGEPWELSKNCAFFPGSIWKEIFSGM